MDTPTQTDMPWVPKPVERHTRRNVSIGLLVLIIVLVLGAGFYLIHSAGPLRGVRYLSGTFDSRTLYELGISGPQTIAVSVPGRMVDYTRSNGHEAAIAVDATGAQDVYSIEGGKAAALTHDGGIKTWLALSPDGSTIAYSVRTATTTSSTTSYYDPIDWRVVVVSHGQSQLFNQGYAPGFFTRDGNLYLLYTTPTSVHIVNLATNTHQDIALDRGVPNVFFHPIVSPDGMYIALPDVSTGYFLYSLAEQSGVFTFVPVKPFAKGTTAVAFAGKDTIVSSANNGTTEMFLRFSSVKDPSVVTSEHTLPLVLIQRILP